MAQHSIKVSVPQMEIGNSDVEFTIQRDGKKLGDISISKGDICWYPSGYSYGYRVPWDKFDEIMQNGGTKEKSETEKKREKTKKEIKKLFETA